MSAVNGDSGTPGGFHERLCLDPPSARPLRLTAQMALTPALFAGFRAVGHRRETVSLTGRRGRERLSSESRPRSKLKSPRI